MPVGDGRPGLGQGQLSLLPLVLLPVSRFYVGLLGSVSGMQGKCWPGLGCC